MFFFSLACLFFLTEKDFFFFNEAPGEIRTPVDRFRVCSDSRYTTGAGYTGLPDPLILESVEQRHIHRTPKPAAPIFRPIPVRLASCSLPLSNAQAFVFFLQHTLSLLLFLLFLECQASSYFASCNSSVMLLLCSNAVVGEELAWSVEKEGCVLPVASSCEELAWSVEKEGCVLPVASSSSYSSKMLERVLVAIDGGALCIPSPPPPYHLAACRRV